jgi:hypothetical protein
MHIVALGWIYVVGMAALAEALSDQGTVLGAVFTFLLYGVVPLAVVLYLMGTPARKSALRRAAAAELAQAADTPTSITATGTAATRGRAAPAAATTTTTTTTTTTGITDPAAAAPALSAPRLDPHRSGHAAGGTAQAAVSAERKEP